MDKEEYKISVEKEFTNGVKLRDHVFVDWKNIYDRLLSSNGDWTKLIPLYVGSIKNGISLKDRITEDELLVVLEGINITNPDYFIPQGTFSDVSYLMQQSAELCMTKVIYYLVECCGVDPNVGNPIRSASEHGCTDVLKYLLILNNIEVKLIDNSVFVAVSFNHLECVKILLSDSRLPADGFIKRLLFNACSRGYAEITKFLLEDPRIDPSWNNNDAIKTAVWGDYPQCLILLLENQRLKISKRDLQKLLLISCKKGYLDIAKVLLEIPGIDPSWNNNKAIKSTYNETAVVDFLLKDNRVRSTLTKEELSEYESLLGG